MDVQIMWLTIWVIVGSFSCWLQLLSINLKLAKIIDLAR